MQDVTRSLAAIENLIAVLDSATVDGVRHCGLERTEVLRPALIHTTTVLDAFGGEPDAGLENRDDFGGFELFGERNNVVDVIEVRVRNQNGVDAIEVVALRIGWVAVHPRVHYDGFAGIEAELESSVT